MDGLETFNWQRNDWPEFRYDAVAVSRELMAFAEHNGRIAGLLEGLPDGLGMEAMLDLMIAEAVKTSAIEGENLDRGAVKSSIRNRLGLNAVPERVDSRMADGAGELMVSVRNTFAEPLSEGLLFSWHRMLLGGAAGLRVGAWREGGDPMQVVSGRIDKPTVHFEAPPAASVPAEMSRFIDWYNATAPGGSAEIIQAPVRAALVHLYFESVHPFEDCNGRIGRALSEKALAQGLGGPAVLSLSQAILAERNGYYDALQTAQRSREVTPWLRWFAGMILAAQADAEAQVRFILRKHRFFLTHEAKLNPRQLKVIEKMFRAGTEGFTGGMNARKYVALTGTSKATATRDLQELAEMGVLVPTGGGRSTRYELPDGAPE
jgi:Fic family protein